MGEGEFPDRDEKVPAPDTVLNRYMKEAIGNKKDAAVGVVGDTASILAYMKGTLGLIHAIIEGRLVCLQNYPSLVTIDGSFRFAASLIDNDSGAIAVGKITPGTYNLYKVRGAVKTTIVTGGAFSKQAGQIYVDIVFDDTEYNPDDIYLLEPQLDTTVDIDGDDFYAPLVSWSGLISDLGNMETKIDAILLDTGTTLPDELADIEGSGYDSTTDSLKVLREQIDINEGKINTIDTVVDGIAVEVADIEGTGFDSTTDSLKVLSDNIDVIDGNVDDINVTKQSQKVFWSDIQPTVVIPAVAANLNFPDVVIPADSIPDGATITAVYTVIKWRKQVDSSAAPNAITGTGKCIRVKKSTGAWGTDDIIAIDLPDNTLATAASQTESGDCMIGDNELSSEVDGEATYNFRGDETESGDAPVVDGASLTLCDVQMGLIVQWR